MKDFHVQLAKILTEMIEKWPFMSHQFKKKILHNCKNTEAKRIVIYVVAMDPIKI